MRLSEKINNGHTSSFLKEILNESSINEDIFNMGDMRDSIETENLIEESEEDEILNLMKKIGITIIITSDEHKTVDDDIYGYAFANIKDLGDIYIVFNNAYDVIYDAPLGNPWKSIIKIYKTHTNSDKIQEYIKNNSSALSDIIKYVDKNGYLEIKDEAEEGGN